MTVFVSLQASGTSDPAGAHLATGLLIGPDLVVVPTLPRQVLARHESFEALLVPAKGDVERLPVSHTLVYPGDSAAESGSGEAVALVLRLGRPTALPAVEAPLRKGASVLTTLRSLLPDADETAARLATAQAEPRIPYSPDRRPVTGAPLVPLAEPLSGTHSVEEFPDSPGICDWVPWC